MCLHKLPLVDFGIGCVSVQLMAGDPLNCGACASNKKPSNDNVHLLDEKQSSESYTSLWFEFSVQMMFPRLNGRLYSKLRKSKTLIGSEIVHSFLAVLATLFTQLITISPRFRAGPMPF